MNPLSPAARKLRYLSEWLFLGAALLVISAAVGYLQYQDHVQTESLERERLINQTQVVERNIALQLAAARRAFDSIIHDLPQWRKAQAGYDINLRLDTISSTITGISSIILVDRGGRVIGADEARLIGMDMSARAYFKTASHSTDRGQLYISPPFITALGFASIAIARDIRTPSGAFDGMVVAALDPDFFSGQLDAIRYMPDTWSVLIHGDGKLFSMMPERRELVGEDIDRGNGFLRQHLGSGRPVSAFVGPGLITADKRMVVMRTVQPPELAMDKPLVIAVSRDFAAIHADWRREFSVNAALLLVSMGVATLGLSLYQRRQRNYDRQVDLQDVTRLAAEQALKASEASYRALFEQAAVGVAEIDSNTGHFLRVNRRYTEIVGYTAQEMKHLDCPTITHPDDLADHLAKMARLRRGEIRALETEKRYLRKSGESVWVKLTISPLWAPGEPPNKHISVVQDISERKLGEIELLAAKQAAEESNQTKSRFLTAVSHDLRQPIQAINLFHSALERTSLTADQRQLCHYLSLSIRSLGDMLNSLLDISRLEAGVITYTPEAVPVDEFFARIDEEFSPLATAANLRFKLFFPAGDLALHVDPQLLMSLLRNLIGNSFKYTRRGGVLVGLRRRGSEALLQVWDTGVGIDQAYIARIFEAYFQIDNPERDRDKGLGLGLSIVSLIARTLGTQVVCRSRHGRGSVFELRLPLVMAPETPDWIPEATPQLAPPSMPASSVAVIEDDGFVAQAIGLALESIGLTVLRFVSAEEALASPQIAEANCIVSDYRLPGLNGMELLETLQARTEEPLKAILLTGDAATLRFELTRSCRWPVLYKPIDLEKLLAALRQQGLGLR